MLIKKDDRSLKNGVPVPSDINNRLADINAAAKSLSKFWPFWIWNESLLRNVSFLLVQGKKYCFDAHFSRCDSIRIKFRMQRFLLTCMCTCGGGGVSALMSSSSVTVGLWDLLTSRRPNLTIPGIWVILTWWGLCELFFFRERPLLEEDGTAEPEVEEQQNVVKTGKEMWGKTD